MNLKKLVKALLFPHIAIMLTLVPIATALLIYAMVFVGTTSVIAYISYILSAYTLAVWCIKLPHLIKYFKNIKENNKYIRIYANDARLRVNLSLYGSLAYNFCYAILQLILGIVHGSFWFYSLATYYICLAIMRFILAMHSTKHLPRERMRQELIKYRSCGWAFLAINTALVVMIFFMIYFNRTFKHHEITTIAMAAYTFTAFTVAIVNIVKYRKYNSPVYSASKAISFSAACVSILTLESTMLNTFGKDSSPEFIRLMLALTGGAISIVIIIMAIAMIFKSTKQLNNLKIQDNR